MNLLKLPNLKADKNNKFLVDLVNKINNALSSFDKTLTNLIYTVDNIDSDINKINENYVKRLDVQPLALSGYGFKNNSYIIENENGYFININIDIYPQQSTLTLATNVKLCQINTNLNLKDVQSLQFITYNDSGTNVYNLHIGFDNKINTNVEGLTCNQHKTGKIFGTIIIDK